MKRKNKIKSTVNDLDKIGVRVRSDVKGHGFLMVYT